ncbi:MAG: hypothetical protein OXC44_06170 [Proteobacteria bacterium]|nr:hypothetical protein [Pseudomonadota bacterium]
MAEFELPQLDEKQELEKLLQLVDERLEKKPMSKTRGSSKKMASGKSARSISSSMSKLSSFSGGDWTSSTQRTSVKKTSKSSLWIVLVLVGVVLLAAGAFHYFAVYYGR